MLSDYQIISQFINESRLMVIQSQADKGLRASGKSAAELGANLGDRFGQLIDRAGYFYYQEFGRKPGTFPPFKAIWDWLAFEKHGLKWNYSTQYSRPIKHVSKEDIGLGLANHQYETITITPEERRKRLTFAIMHSIKKKGTYTHQHGRTNVISDVVNQERLSTLRGDFANKYKTQVKSDIITEFKPKN